MQPSPEPMTDNTFLAALTKGDFELLRPQLKWTELALGQVLTKAYDPIKYVYFPMSGICSIIAQNKQGIQIETGLIGHEGFTGIPVVFFVDTTPSQTIVQAGGRAVRITRTKFLKAIQQSPSLFKMVLWFAYIFHVQVSQTAVSIGHYTIHQRLARWLLMCHDRADAPDFPMTHRFLAMMLAVRRAGITDALNFLEGKKAIRAMRSKIVIIDRSVLEEIAGASYGVSEQEYKRLIA